MNSKSTLNPVNEKYKNVDGLASNAEVTNWFEPVVLALNALGGSAKRTEVHAKIIEMYHISEEALSQKNVKTNTSKIINNIDWARNYLTYEGIINKEIKGVWRLSELGKKILMTKELAQKIFAKWVRVKTAERKKTPLPEIDLSSYYIFAKPYTKERFLQEVYISSELYDALISRLKSKKNIILQGAPGVGKTYAAKRLAYAMMGQKDDSRIEFIQFHQSYSYEDFIMGYRPQENGFKLQEGVFYRFCQKAAENSEKDHFFIIDEINRGNMSKIFGEMLMLIESDHRDDKIKLAYSDTVFCVPGNVCIIGMMNTADRSLAMIDYALRRRFSFFEMEPGFNSDGFKAYQSKINNKAFDALIKCIQNLNRDIAEDNSLGKGFCIGHSYFCNCADNVQLKEIVEHDIIPMLAEYWFDERGKLREWENKLRGVFNER